MTTFTMNPLTARTVAEGYVLIDRGVSALNDTKENVWGMLVQYSSASINDKGEESSKRVAAFIEETVGAAIVDLQGGKKTKPGSYRSAKSVICKAVMLGVPLFDVDGNVRGKTEVEKDCKEDRTDEQKVDSLLDSIQKILDNGYAITADQKAIMSIMLAK